MTMTAQRVLLAAELLTQCQHLDNAMTRLDKMDKDPMANMIGQIGFGLEMHGPSLSPGAANAIRALMRADYQKARADLVTRLGNLEVKLETL